MSNFIAAIHQYFFKHRYLLIVAIVLFTALTLLLTLLPISDIGLPSGIISHDKVGHFLLFGGWTFLVGYYRFASKPDGAKLWLVFLAGIIFGGCVEGIQGLPPFQRDPSLFDWIADSVGALCSTLILYAFTNWPKKKDKKGVHFID